MRQHRFMRLIGGAATPGPRVVPPAAAGDSFQDEEQDFPLIFANLPAAGPQKTLAAGVAALLVFAAAVVAPFANIQLGRVDAFIPVLQTALSIADLITAALLFAQYSIQPQQRALLAVASGYVFSGSFAFLQTLTFPGGYGPAGLIGDGSNSAAWIYVLWHTMFPAAILVYVFTKDAIGFVDPPGKTKANIIITVASVLATIAVLTWIVTTKTEYIPIFYTNDVNVQTRFGNRVNLALWLWGATALAVLFARRRTVLDLWLMVTLLACMPNFLVAIIGSSVRFTIGWYAARGFVLVSSCVLLTVLIIETMLLYSRLASAVTLQRREHTNRLLTVDAVTGAIAHELNSPLGAIALNANTGLCQLRASPRELEGMENILSTIEADSYRAAATISSIREMTTKTNDGGAQTSAENAAQLALRLLKDDLQINQISVATGFLGNLPEVQIDGEKLQQVLLNLVRNAIDAMRSTPPEARRLRLKTSFDGQSTVFLSVQDSGRGISPDHRERIFDPFFTTKLDGMGLGLAISSTLVERSGGKLRLIKSEFDGSIFELALPVGERRSTTSMS